MKKSLDFIELAKLLQEQLNDRLESISEHAREAKKLREAMQEKHRYMAEIAREIEAFLPIVYQQHPEKKEMFEALLREYPKDE